MGRIDTGFWHRRLCPVAEGVMVGGDLAEDPDRAASQLADWRAAGITHVLDTRYEWSDADFVAERVPEITYGWVGTDDDGRRRPDSWFDQGVAFALRARDVPGSLLLVHCHMGINRGPSMAFRILLEFGWDPMDALDAIHRARPIADIGYADNALDHFQRRHAVTPELGREDTARVAAWLRAHPTRGPRLHRTPG